MIHKTAKPTTRHADTSWESYLRSFGDRLRELRKARRLRQVDMVTYNLNYKYYQRLEAGQINPTLLTLYKVAAAFKVSVYDLLQPAADAARPVHGQAEENAVKGHSRVI